MEYKGKFPVTVKELIEYLQQMRPDAIVIAQDEGLYNVRDIVEIKSSGKGVAIVFKKKD